MIVYLKSGGALRERLRPDVDHYTRRLEVDGTPSLKEILDGLEIPLVFVAFAFVNGKFEHLDYRPADGETVTLQPPVAGG